MPQHHGVGRNAVGLVGRNAVGLVGRNLRAADRFASSTLSSSRLLVLRRVSAVRDDDGAVDDGGAEREDGIPHAAFVSRAVRRDDARSRVGGPDAFWDVRREIERTLRRMRHLRERKRRDESRVRVGTRVAKPRARASPRA